MKLLEFYANLKDRIEDDNVVKENFQMIFNKYKKGANANKEAIEELEKKFFAGEKLNIARPGKKPSDNNNMKGKKRTGVKRNYSKMRNPSSMDDESSLEVSEVDPASRFGSNTKLKTNVMNATNNIQPSGPSSRNTRNKNNNNRVRKIILEDDDGDYEEDSDF
jgi:hypothetical protein